jgi:hypothetical protein
MKSDEAIRHTEQFGHDEAPTRPQAPRLSLLDALHTDAPTGSEGTPAKAQLVLPASSHAWLTRTLHAVRAPFRTATNRWRAVAAAALETGIGRLSDVDRDERAAPAEPGEPGATEPSADAAQEVAVAEAEASPTVSGVSRVAAPLAEGENEAPEERLAVRKLGPRGTVRMPAHGGQGPAPGPTGTMRLPAHMTSRRAAPPAHAAAPVRRRLAKRPWLTVASIGVLLGMQPTLIAVCASRDATRSRASTQVDPLIAEPAATTVETIAVAPPIADQPIGATATANATTTAPAAVDPAKHAAPAPSAAKHTRPRAGSSVF